MFKLRIFSAQYARPGLQHPEDPGLGRARAPRPLGHPSGPARPLPDLLRPRRLPAALPGVSLRGEAKKDSVVDGKGLGQGQGQAEGQGRKCHSDPGRAQGHRQECTVGIGSADQNQIGAILVFEQG